jgi:hypothetical protein
MQVQIEEGSVSEDFLIKDFLPECDWESSVSALSGDDGGDVGSIAFEELRLHLSGLPAQPPNRAETGSPGGNPFGGYTVGKGYGRFFVIIIIIIILFYSFCSRPSFVN